MGGSSKNYDAYEKQVKNGTRSRTNDPPPPTKPPGNSSPKPKSN